MNTIVTALSVHCVSAIQHSSLLLGNREQAFISAVNDTCENISPASLGLSSPMRWGRGLWVRCSSSRRSRWPVATSRPWACEGGGGSAPSRWSCPRCSGRWQVWSLTQFYCVDFFTIKGRCKQVRFQQMHNQALRQLLLTVSCWLPPLARNTRRSPCFSVAPEATHEASQGSKTRELLGGIEENSVSLTRGHWFALQANQWFLYK